MKICDRFGTPIRPGAHVRVNRSASVPELQETGRVADVGADMTNVEFPFGRTEWVDTGLIIVLRGE